MKTAEFNKDYSIDRTARGIKANAKRTESTPALTADGSLFDSATTYFFFDRSGRTVRESTGLRRVGSDHLGSMGLKITAIENLHISKDDALEDGQKYFINQIDSLRDSIREFEEQKGPENRTLKYLLMSRG